MELSSALGFDNFYFEEASKYFGEKMPLTADEFYQLSEKYRKWAFTVSGYTAAEVLNQFYDEILLAIDEGSTMEAFRENTNTFLERNGYEGITRYQADNIFRTNIQTAYQAGHYEQMTQPAVKKLRPYWQYDAVNDSATRPEHLAMDGLVFAADNPIWDVWYPPNGFRCRCGVNTLSKRQVEERGLKVEDSVPEAVELPDGTFVRVSPDPSFAVNPAKEPFKPDLTGYPESVRKAFEVEMSSFE